MRFLHEAFLSTSPTGRGEELPGRSCVVLGKRLQGNTGFDEARDAASGALHIGPGRPPCTSQDLDCGIGLRIGSMPVLALPGRGTAEQRPAKCAPLAPVRGPSAR